MREERYSIDQWQDDAARGRLIECFACGTAAVVTPIGNVRGRDVDFTIGNGRPGMLTEELREQLVSIQRGQKAGPAWLAGAAVRGVAQRSTPLLSPPLTRATLPVKSIRSPFSEKPR